MRKPIRSLGLFLARFFGSRILDVHTGRVIDRALVVCFRGKVYVIGARENLRPVFEPQKRLTYWRQKIGFTVHEPPDFPREAPPRDEQ